MEYGVTYQFYLFPFLLQELFTMTIKSVEPLMALKNNSHDERKYSVLM